MVARDANMKEIKVGDVVVCDLPPHGVRDYEVEDITGDEATVMLIIVPVEQADEDDGWTEVAAFLVSKAF